MNHLIVGLGGTGGKIIREFRKQLYQSFRSENAAGVATGYLYVDSSSEMMAIDDPTWKTLGVSVQLPKASQLLITEANLAARLANLDNYPGIKPWIGERVQWQDILNSIVGVTLGGQKRRLGRFLFACKADRFREQAQSQVKLLQQGGTTETTFHVLCGLAGGTGCGSVIDVLAQLRELYPDAKRYRILVYALLPDQYPNPNWDTGNYHANGYAGLLELNALSTGVYQPWDVMGVNGRLAKVDPFNGCYVFTNENENGLTVNVDREIPAIVADFLFQKIVAARSLSWASLGRMENAENGDGSPETAPDSRAPERSKRFLAFGIKRVAIPNEEITEYLTYQFARQAVLQLRYNNWQDTLGYVDEPKNTDYHELVRQRDSELKWLLSDDHVTLSLGILPEDANNKKWRPITQEWEAVIPAFKSLVRERERKTWLDELMKLTQKRFEEDYRTLGVANFYRTKLKAKREMALEIRGRIERELYNDWKIGARSTHDCARLLTALIEHLDERLAGFDDKIAKARVAEDEVQARLFANSGKWAGMGLVSKLIGTPDSLFDAHGVLLQELHVNRTRIEGLAFAKQLMQEIIAEITELKAEIDQASSTIQEAIKFAARNIDARIRDEDSADLRSHNVRFYSAPAVKKVARALATDEAEQRTQTARVRAALIERLGENATFFQFNQRIGLAHLIDTLEGVCVESVRIAHANLVEATREKVMGASIIEKLKERFGADREALRTYVSDLVMRAGNFIAFDPNEMHKAAPGIPAGVPTAISKFTVIVPKAPEHAEFLKALKDAFLAARSGDVEIIESDVGQSEITLVSITNLFPLRYVKALGFLAQKYEQRIASNPARARLELHTEGDGTQMPRLFVASAEEVKREGTQYVLLAKGLGFIVEQKNPATGLPETLLLTKDADGFDNEPVALGRNFLEACDRLDLKALHTIKREVERALNGKDYLHEDKRQGLSQRIVQEVDAIKAALGGNLQDETYKRFLDGGKRAVKLLRREA